MKKVLLLTVLGAFLYGVPANATPYTDCLESKEIADDAGRLRCTKEETAKLLQSIKSEYEKIVANSTFAAWNNGNGMQSGNLRNMYDNWLSYRDKYCALKAISMEHSYGKESGMAQCLLDLTQRHYDDLQRVMSEVNTDYD